MNIKHIILLSITLMLLFVGCDDRSYEPSLPITGEDREVEMALLSTRGLSGQVDTAAVLQLDLVVCKDGYYQYSRQAYTSQYATFRSTLKIDEGVDIYFFANCRSLLNESGVLTEGARWQDIQAEMILRETSVTINGTAALPMWGQAKNVAITDQQINNLGTIHLLRAVASTNVYFNLDPEENGGGTFVPKVAYIYNGADRGFAAPEEENLTYKEGQISGVKAPVSPEEMRTVVTSSADAIGNAFENTLYMFENETNATTSKNGNKRTRLVVGGHYNGSKELTYYPLDFVNTESGTILPVTRNDQYKIFITAVNAEGYPTPGEAAENAAVNLSYEVINWNEYEHKDVAVDGINYLSISKKNVTLYRNPGSKTMIYLSGTYKKENISLSFHPNSLNGTAITTDSGLENERFKVELTGQDTFLTLTITALAEYNQAEPQTNFDTLQIKAGRILFDVNIEQITSRGWDNGGSDVIDF